MSLLGDDRAYQDLLGQNASFISQDINDLDIKDSLTLEYVNPNEVLITDADKKVISTNDLDVNTITLNEGSVSSPAVLIGGTADGWRFYKSNNLYIGNSAITARFFFTETAFKGVGNKTLGDSLGSWDKIYVDELGKDLDLTNKKLYFYNKDNTISGFGPLNEIYIGTNSKDDRFVFGATSFYTTDNVNTTLGNINNKWSNAYISTVNSSVVNAIYSVVSPRIILREDKSYIQSNNDQQLNFYTDNQTRVFIETNSFSPASGLTFNLGKTTNRFRNLYLETSIDLNGTTLDSTQFNRLVAIDQDLTTTSDVDFNSLELNSNLTINNAGDIILTDISSQLMLPINSSLTESTINFGDGQTACGFGSSNTSSINVYIEGSKKFVYQNNNFRPFVTNTLDLGSNVRRWKNTYMEGFLMTSQLQSNDYDAGATGTSPEALILVNGRKQFIRYRTGGAPALMSGMICSYFDTSNFYIYNSNLTGNLRIAHNALISGVGSGYENATNCVDITSSGHLIAELLSSLKVNTPQFEIYVDESNLSYNQTINSANTWQNFTNIPTINEDDLIDFTRSGSTLLYTGTETRRFVLEYKITARKSGSGAFIINMGILHNGTTTISRSIQEHRKATNDTSTFSGRCVLNLSTNDTIVLQLKQNGTNTIIIHSWYFSGMDLLQKPF